MTRVRMFPRHTEKQFEIAADWLINDRASVNYESNASSQSKPFFDPFYKAPELSNEEKLARKQYREICFSGFRKDIIDYFRSCSKSNPDGTIGIDCDYFIHNDEINKICQNNSVTLTGSLGNFFSINITADGKVYATTGKYSRRTDLYNANEADCAIKNNY